MPVLVPKVPRRLSPFVPRWKYEAVYRHSNVSRFAFSTFGKNRQELRAAEFESQRVVIYGEILQLVNKSSQNVKANTEFLLPGNQEFLFNESPEPIL